MKKILITGENGFVGNAFARWVAQFPDKYQIEFLSVRDDIWQSMSFEGYDVILHVAAIVHQVNQGVTEETYNKVNFELTRELAIKAKKSAVKQFVFLSTMSVYGDKFGVETRINATTPANPSTPYGVSKLKAEKELELLDDQGFNVCILRPPLIYGKGTKGNYPRLVILAKKLPVFPNVRNYRSMIYIDNLSEFIRLIIQNEERGVFFPQNKDYVNTSELVRVIADSHGKKVHLTSLFNVLITPLIGRVRTINKVFGSLVYEKELSEYRCEYSVKSFRDSVRETEID